MNRNDYQDIVEASINNCLVSTDFDFGKKYDGKVRDTYDLGDELVMVTTDRLSAFDRILAAIPFKGQALNQTSAWWFEQTKHIVSNHLLASPDPNVMVVKKCEVFPIEFVVRGYITGTTNTSLWTQYAKGVREYCGIQFAEGLQKNQALNEAVLTPTTKDKVHDKPISPAEIVNDGWMNASDWEAASEIALKLFAYGSARAKENGLILVDTKYELGKDSEGNIILIDEIHTPDSSRYWIASSYKERIAQGLEPENIDKEFLRIWFAKNCDPYKDQTLPEAPQALIVTLALRYIQLYEMITGNVFNFTDYENDAAIRVRNNIANYIG